MVNKVGLLALADLLETRVVGEIEAGTGSFDLISWFTPASPDVDQLISEGNMGSQPAVSTSSCETAGCAVGWAIHAGIIPGLTRHPTVASPFYNGHPNFTAVQLAFGISKKQAYYLFSRKEYEPENRKNPERVAARIRKFVECQEKGVDEK